MKYGEKLRALRDKKGLSQKELTERLNINRSTYARYETSSTQPDYDTLKKLADFFEVSTDYLLGRNNPSNDSKLTKKDERDIAKKLEAILGELDNDNALAFDGEPMNETTRELVKAQIESNLRVAKEMARKKFTPKKYQTDDSE